MKRIFLHILFALLFATNAFSSSIQVGDGLKVSGGGLFDLVSKPSGSVILEWLYEGDGIVPRIAEDYTAVFTRAYGDWCEDENGVLQPLASDIPCFEYISGTYVGYSQKPQRKNEITAHNASGVDQLGSEILNNTTFDGDTNWAKTGDWQISGGTANTITSFETLTADTGVAKGKVYQVTYNVTTGTARFKIGNTYIGASSGAGSISAVSDGTQIVIQGVTVPCAVDSISYKEIGGTKLNSDGSSEGTFVSGWGKGAQASFNTTWSQPFTNITISGGQDGVSTATVFDDSAKMPTGDRDYSNLNVSGKVLKVVAGSADVYLDYTGGLTAADHAISVITRGDSASDDDITCETDNVGGTPQDLTDEYARYAETITALLADKTRLTVSAGDTVYLFLTQGELGSTITSEIITQGAAVTKAIDDQKLPVADGVNHRDAQGELSFKVVFGYDAADVSTDQGLVTWNDNATDGVSYDGTNLTISDGTNTATVALAAVAGTEYEVKARWNSTSNKMQIKVDSTIGVEGTYDGAMSIGTNYRLGYGDDERIWLNSIRVKRTDPGVYL